MKQGLRAEAGIFYEDDAMLSEREITEAVAELKAITNGETLAIIDRARSRATESGLYLTNAIYAECDILLEGKES